MCGVAVLLPDDHPPALRAEGAFEVLRQQARVVHAAVVDDGRRACAELIGGVLALAAACPLSPKQARKSQFGTCFVRRGEVAPLVTKGTPARAAIGAAASTWSVSERPTIADTPAATRLAAARRTSSVSGLSVALDQLDAAAEQAAGGVDAVDGQARPVQRRGVQRRLVAGEVVDGADADGAAWSGCAVTASSQATSVTASGTGERRYGRRAHERRGPSACPLAPHGSHPW